KQSRQIHPNPKKFAQAVPRSRNVADRDTRPSSESQARAAWPGRTMTTVLLFRLLTVLALLMLTSPSATAASQNPRHVLLIYGEQKDLPMNRIVDVQLRSSFREKLGDGVDLFSEYIDLTRIPDERIHRKQLEFLHDKYSAHGLDLIVVIDASA